MFQRLIPMAGVLLIALSVVPTVWAGSRIVFQQTSRRPNGQMYISRPLVPGRAYRIDITARGHRAFSGFGTEFFNGISNRQLFTGNQSLVLHGTTPQSFMVRQPGRTGVRAWDLAISVRLASGSGLTVRLVDLGKSK